MEIGSACLCFWDVFAGINIFGVLYNSACLRLSGVKCNWTNDSLWWDHFQECSGLLIVQYYGINLPFFLQRCCLFAFVLVSLSSTHTFILLLKSSCVCRICSVLHNLLFLTCVKSIMWYRSCTVLLYDGFWVYVRWHIFLLIFLPAVCRLCFCSPQSLLQGSISALFKN